MRIAAHGLAVRPPPGWDARIRRHRHGAEASETASTQFRAHPVLHAADFALSDRRGDFGSGVVEWMAPTNGFIALVEYHPENATTALFSANTGMPDEVGVDDFSPHQLQRTIRGQAGMQYFFSAGGRAFCLYLVLGSLAHHRHAVPRLNEALAAIEIEAR